MRRLVVAAGVALVLTGLASAAPQADTYNLNATLKARSEVPRPTGVPVGANGLFKGKAVELANDRARLTWRLTFWKLSGRAMAAHVHSGGVGKAGGVMVPLCGPCRSGQRGSSNPVEAFSTSSRLPRSTVPADPPDPDRVLLVHPYWQQASRDAVIQINLERSARSD